MLSELFFVDVAAAVRPVLSVGSRLPAATNFTTEHAYASSVWLLLPASAATESATSGRPFQRTIVDVFRSQLPVPAAAVAVDVHGADLACSAAGVGGEAGIVASGPATAHRQRRLGHAEATTPTNGGRRDRRHVAKNADQTDVGPATVDDGPRVPEPRLREDVQQEFAPEGAPENAHRGETVSMWVAWVWVEVRAVRRADPSLPQAHRRPTVRMHVL